LGIVNSPTFQMNVKTGGGTQQTARN
jgi:hypothetical protein